MVKALLRKNVLNDVTAALFSVSFSQLPAAKNTASGASVTILSLYFVRVLAMPRKEFTKSKSYYNSSGSGFTVWRF